VGATVFFSSANELATLTNTFKVSGTATDPTTVSLIVTDPTGAATTYTYALSEITKSGTGVYTKDVACSTAGDWSYEWVGTGTASDATAGTWTVFETSLGHLYCTVDALKSRLGIPLTDTVDDYELYSACFTASRWIDEYCERVFYRSATGTARTFEPHNFYWLKLPEYHDLVSVSAFATDSSGDGTYETAWTSTDYQLYPLNPSAAPEQRPYTKVKAVGSRLFPLLYPALARTDLVQITGVWGWPSVPWGIKEAAKVLAAELFKLKDAPFGVAGFGDLGLIRIRENPKVAALAGRYQRNPWLAA
jgi:hypothetical protein